MSRIRLSNSNTVIANSNRSSREETYQSTADFRVSSNECIEKKRFSARVIFYFSKIATDLWSLSLLVLGLDVIILICAMITFDFIGVPLEGMPVIGLILSILIFWGSYVLLNRFRMSLRVSKLAEEKEVVS